MQYSLFYLFYPHPLRELLDVLCMSFMHLRALWFLPPMKNAVQVTSGRRSVTPNCVITSDQVQTKMAEGATPGEGNGLPGSKVKGDCWWEI